MTWNWAALIAALLAGGTALYIRLRWRRAASLYGKGCCGALLLGSREPERSCVRGSCASDNRVRPRSEAATLLRIRDGQASLSAVNYVSVPPG